MEHFMRWMGRRAREMKRKTVNAALCLGNYAWWKLLRSNIRFNFAKKKQDIEFSSRLNLQRSSRPTPKNKRNSKGRKSEVENASRVVDERRELNSRCFRDEEEKEETSSRQLLEIIQWATAFVLRHRRRLESSNAKTTDGRGKPQQIRSRSAFLTAIIEFDIDRPALDIRHPSR